MLKKKLKKSYYFLRKTCKIKKIEKNAKFLKGPTTKVKPQFDGLFLN